MLRSEETHDREVAHMRWTCIDTSDGILTTLSELHSLDSRKQVLLLRWPWWSEEKMLAANLFHPIQESTSLE